LYEAFHLKIKANVCAKKPVQARKEASRAQNSFRNIILNRYKTKEVK
jgi:hypothetical protein